MKFCFPSFMAEYVRSNKNPRTSAEDAEEIENLLWNPRSAFSREIFIKPHKGKTCSAECDDMGQGQVEFAGVLQNS